MIPGIPNHDHREQQAGEDAGDSPQPHSRQREPNRGGGGEQHRDRDDSVFPAESIQQKHQRQTTPRRSQKIEEIDAVHALDGLRDHQRNDDSRSEKRQRSREVNQDKIERADLRAPSEHEHDSPNTNPASIRLTRPSLP